MRKFTQILMNQFRNLKLNTKLLITFSLVSLVPLVSILFLSYYNSAKVLEQEFGASVIEISRQVERQLDAFDAEMKHISNVVLFNKDLQFFLSMEKHTNNTQDVNTIRYLRMFIGDLVTIRPGLRGIFVVNDLGLVVYEANEMADLSYDFNSDPWYVEAIAKHNYALLPAHPQTYVKGDSVITYLVRLTDHADFQEKGTLLIDFDPEYISKMNENIHLGETGYVFMLTQDGQAVVPNQPSPFNIAQNKEFQRLISGRSGHFLYEWNGEQLLIGYSTSQKTGYKIVGAVPFHELASRLDYFRNIMFIIGALAIGIILIFSSQLSRIITAPLRRLQQYMKEVEGGDFSSRIPVERHDEFGLLEKKFNRMVSQLDQLQHKVSIAQVREYHLQFLNKESELKALQAQINPHFLYNTLNTMSCIGQVYQVDEISVVSDALAGMFKYSIVGGSHSTMEEEIQHVKHYMEIIHVRYPDMITCHYHVEEHFLDQPVLKLILQPLVENAVLHGLLPRKGKGQIWISVVERNETILIRVVDDGIGIEEGKLVWLQDQLSNEDSNELNRNNLGLYNVKQRLFLYYGTQGKLRFASEPDRGMVVEIAIPVDNPKEGETNVSTPGRG